MSGQTSSQTFQATSWQKLSETSKSTLWVREVRGKFGQLVMTLTKNESELKYGLTLPCPQSKKSVTYIWNAGDAYSTAKKACDGKGAEISTVEAERFFQPLPDGISPHKPAEIFINPEQPQIIA